VTSRRGRRSGRDGRDGQGGRGGRNRQKKETQNVASLRLCYAALTGRKGLGMVFYPARWAGLRYFGLTGRRRIIGLYNE
jgi:hypothetical protein